MQVSPHSQQWWIILIFLFFDNSIGIKMYVEVSICIALTAAEAEHCFPLCIALVYVFCESPVCTLSHVFYWNVHFKVDFYNLFID